MGIVAIAEPDTAVAELIAAVVVGLGHVPLDVRTAGEIAHADALVVEPGDEYAYEWARFLRAWQPSLAVVCVSTYDAFPLALELQPVAYLPKPFAIDALEVALRRALG
jgi:hypothetical protein